MGVWFGIPKHTHADLPPPRLASILVEFAREVKEAHMIILAEEATKKHEPKRMPSKAKSLGGARGRLLPAVKSGTIDLSELLTSAGNMKKSRAKRQNSMIQSHSPNLAELLEQEERVGEKEEKEEKEQLGQKHSV